MEQTKPYKFDSTDKKVINIFSELGMPKNLAKTLIYISKVDECRSAEIEKQANLRQPEVSVAMQQLQDRGWIDKRYKKKEGKGRPVHIYKLSKTMDDIIENFEEEKMQEVKSVEKDLNDLRKLVDER